MTAGTNRLAGKVVIITGTGSGQGRTAARTFAREGATVIGADLNAAGNAETAALVASDGYAMDATHPVDLGDPGAVNTWIGEAIERHGRVDVLYNNASVPRFGAFGDVSEEDFRFTVRNEIDIVWFPSKAVWGQMVNQGGGVIINVGSIAGIVGDRGFGQTAHALTKGAVIAFTRQLAAEGAAHGIRVNSVSPGTIATPTVLGMLEELGDDAPFMGMIRHTFNNAPGSMEDPVNAALFLASDDAGWITGQDFVVDGGTSVFI
ncbi:SDR family NAD(P)-dependent oxidoreductase [Herbiconiux sp. P16]|uniref:SDR family NAD(P)-dependent oxidoreductase n=1 Tax=Herbiconiux wuyangfengii TaxID=3342794 RepID=UPI0035B79F7F